MRTGGAKVGVCLVRVESQPYGALITVRLTPDVGRALAVSAEPTTDLETALTLIANFLRDFIADAELT